MIVFDDAEMDRIVGLPRRDWTDARKVEAARLLTAWLKKPAGTMSLKPVQAQALVEAHDTGGLVGELAAGSGKTLTTFLLPVVVKARRTLLLVPAKLREKTFDDWQDLAKHWTLPPLLGVEDTGPAPNESIIRVQSYESLSHINYASFVDEYDPDLIIADEAHFLSRMKAGRSKRVFRFLKNAKKQSKKVTFIPLSGTMRRKSFRDCAHLYEAALGDKSPLPVEYPSLEQWCYALDEGVKAETRYKPGALLRLATEDEKAGGLDGVRRAIRRRLVDSAGVVATTELSCSLPLTLQVRPIEVPNSVRTAMHRLRTDYELPTGDTVDAGIAFWQHAREIASGFAYRWDPPAPKPWLEARRAWNAFVRARLDHPGKLKLDTPLQVWNAVEAGQFGRVVEWEAWKAIRNTFEPKTVPHWISDYLVRDAEAWAKQTGGIVWVSHTAAYTGDDDDDVVGNTFREIPYFGAGDERIKTYKGPCAASIRSHGTGKNLTQWHKALILAFPSSGSTLEQLLARHHRERQEADLVEFYFYLHSKEMLAALQTAIGDARFQETTSGSPQRILSAALLDADGHSLRMDSFEAGKAGTNDPMWV
jgi:hypothetical protein